MLPYEDIHFQLVDLPPVSGDFMEPWLVNALQPADGVLLVVDISDPDCLEKVPTILDRLSEKKVFLTVAWPGLASTEPTETNETDDPFRLNLPAVLIANRSDLDPDPEEVEILGQLLGLRSLTLTTSAKTGDGLAELGSFLFRALEIVRVYTKTPGKPAETDKPFTVRRGGQGQSDSNASHDAEGARRARIDRSRFESIEPPTRGFSERGGMGTVP
jgi:ribosome-interacting GTPase 1